MGWLPSLRPQRPERPSSSGAGAGLRRARPGSRLQRSRRARARRWLAAGLVGLAVAVALPMVGPAGRADVGVPTVVAIRPVAAGALISPADVSVEPRRPEDRPDSAAADPVTVVGRRAAGPIEVKGVVTTERLAGAGLLGGRSDDRVAMTVPVMAVALTGVEQGSHVDVYATGSGEQVVSRAQVLAVLGTGGQASPAAGADGEDAGGTGAMRAPMPWDDGLDPGITVAVSPAEAGLLATHLGGLSGGESFVLALRPDR